MLVHVGQGHKDGAAAVAQAWKTDESNRLAAVERQRAARACEEQRMQAAGKARVHASARALRRAAYAADVPLPSVPPASAPNPASGVDSSLPKSYLRVDRTDAGGCIGDEGVCRTLTGITRHDGSLRWSLPAAEAKPAQSTAGQREAWVRLRSSWAAQGCSAGVAACVSESTRAPLDPQPLPQPLSGSTNPAPSPASVMDDATMLACLESLQY